ncbi:MAG: TatD family hydrolase [Patescibacteria group bacterium]|nr:MAG: TatD family hydrolase [Patescibacteria group bacterium]
MFPKFFDIHSHINDARFDDDREEVIGRMKKEGVWSIVVGTDLPSSKEAVRLAGSHENLFASVGLHPNDNKAEVFDADAYKALAREPKVVAIGECGLDYFRGGDTEDEKKRQKELFVRQVDLAAASDVPLMIHVRDAHADVLDILSSKKKGYGDNLRGNIHFFSGSHETAKKYFNLDFSVSFTGVITFTGDYDEAVQNAPLSMILSETDSPYVAPIPHRGERNEPSYVKEVVKRIAEIRGEDHEDIAKALVDNALRVFGIHV